MKHLKNGKLAKFVPIGRLETKLDTNNQAIFSVAWRGGGGQAL